MVFLKNGSGDKHWKINWVKIMGFRCQAKVLDLDFTGKWLKILILTLSAEMTKSEQHVGEMNISVTCRLDRETSDTEMN